MRGRGGEKRMRNGREDDRRRGRGGCEEAKRRGEEEEGRS